MDCLQKNLEKYIEEMTDRINKIDKEIEILKSQKDWLVNQTKEIREVISNSAIERRNTPIGH